MALVVPTQLRIPEHVVSETVAGEAVLLNLRSGLYFSLNPLGTRVWKLLEDGKSLSEVRSVLLSEYLVTEAELDRDLRELIAQLLQSQLVIEDR